MSDINKIRCPYCFRLYSENNWTHDPLLCSHGAEYHFNDSGVLEQQATIEERLYKGFHQILNIDIKELQDEFIQKEIDVGVLEVNRTTFSTIKDDLKSKWQANKKHIKELRESVEKILTASGQTKEQFFNYDEEGTERRTTHQLDWTDSNLTDATWKGQIKNWHIEDLRHYLSIGGWKQKYWLGVNPPVRYQTIILKETLESTRTNTWLMDKGSGSSMIGIEDILTMNLTGDGCDGLTTLPNENVKITKNTTFTAEYSSSGTVMEGYSSDFLKFSIRFINNSYSQILTYSTEVNPFGIGTDISISSSGNISRNLYNDLISKFPSSSFIALINAGQYPWLYSVGFAYIKQAAGTYIAVLDDLEII